MIEFLALCIVGIAVCLIIVIRDVRYLKERYGMVLAFNDYLNERINGITKNLVTRKPRKKLVK